MVFGGMITLMLLGFLLDQIPDPDFAGIMEVDPNDEAEKGEAKKVSKGKGKNKGNDGSDVTRKKSQTKAKVGSKTSFPDGMQRQR